MSYFAPPPGQMPTSGQIRRQTAKSDRALRATYGPRSKARSGTKRTAVVIAGMRAVFGPAGYCSEAAEAFWRETSPVHKEERA